MRNLIKYLLQGKGLNLVLCAMTISFCTPALAQDDEFEEVETSIKQPDCKGKLSYDDIAWCCDRSEQ